MKRRTYILTSLVLTLLAGAATIWNYSAATVSAQKSDEVENLGVVATEYNARDEFSLTQGGTTGVWNYGYTSGANSNAFIAYPNADTGEICGAGTIFERWTDSSVGVDPGILRNPSTNTYNCAGGQIIFPPELLYLHPGPSGQRAVVRWTAPASGTYQIKGAFRKINQNASTDVKILKNAGTSLFSRNIDGSNSQQPFNFTVTAAAGETIDFSVGYGSNNSYLGDATGLAVTVGPAVEYNAVNDFSLTQGGTNGLWNYGYSASDTDNTLTLFSPATDTDTIAGCNGGIFERWRIANSDLIPQIARHNPPLTCSNIPSNALFIHPGFGGQRAVVRWTAPVGGTFQLTGSLQRMSLGATTDLKIIKNAATPGETVVFAGSNVSTYQITYSVTITVAAGDKLDFSVGNGNGSQIGDSSSIVINIAPPVTACLTLPANLQVSVPAENSPSDVAKVNTNAQLVGDTSYTNSGKVGRAFDFDGAGDYVRIEDNPAQRPANAVTVEGWFKFDSVGGLVSLVSKPLRNSAFNSYSLYLDGGQLRGFAANPSQYTRVFSNFTPQIGVWHHLAFTYDYSGGVSTLKLFANGVEVTSGQDGTPNLPLYYDANPYPLLIGGEYENNAPGFFQDGQADEVSI